MTQSCGKIRINKNKNKNKNKNIPAQAETQMLEASGSKHSPVWQPLRRGKKKIYVNK